MKPLFVMLAVLPFLSACNQPESPNAELFPAAGAENKSGYPSGTNFHG